jgi:hypothetical protein
MFDIAKARVPHLANMETEDNKIKLEWQWLRPGIQNWKRKWLKVPDWSATMEEWIRDFRSETAPLAPEDHEAWGYLKKDYSV